MISIQFTQKDKDGLLPLFNGAAAKTWSFLKQVSPLVVSLTFMGREKMRGLNLSVRGIDRATDVLSFPFLTLPAPKTANGAAVLRAEDFPLDLYGVDAGDNGGAENGGGIFLGDIVICPAVARAQCGAPVMENIGAGGGDAYAREAVFLFTHGLLHLFGYDHIKEPDKKIMNAAETAVLS